MLTSLVGARSSSTRPIGGISPLQLQNRMRMKKATNSGMYGFAVGPAIPSPKSLRNSYSHSKAFCARPGMSLRPRVMRMTTMRTTAMTIHIVRIVELMLG